jgi:hypothetical protein
MCQPLTDGLPSNGSPAAPEDAAPDNTYLLDAVHSCDTLIQMTFLYVDQDNSDRVVVCFALCSSRIGGVGIREKGWGKDN